MGTLIRIHRFCCDRLVYMWIAVAFLIYIFAKYDVPSWGTRWPASN